MPLELLSHERLVDHEVPSVDVRAERVLLNVSRAGHRAQHVINDTETFQYVGLRGERLEIGQDDVSVLACDRACQ